MTQPSELRSRSFVALTTTQFLGAFNDNAFKQLVVLWAAGMATAAARDDTTSAAGALFALPFVIFSGFAGLLADRFSKRRIIVLAKVGEVVVMGVAVLSFWFASVPLLLATVFLMGTQSAFFGPAKYGVLPELLGERELARGNGVILMTTFLSIILGMAAAGGLREAFGEELVYPGCCFVAIALIGTATSTRMRPLPPNDPGVRLRGRPLGDLWPTLKLAAREADLRLVLLANSYFWFMGAVLQLVLPQYGKYLMDLGDLGAMLLLISLSAGMAGGSILGGQLSKGRINFALCYWGMAGMIASLAAMAFAHAVLPAAHLTLFVLGMSGGLFGLPLQTYVQARAEPDQRGRFVAAMNFCNWIFIFLGAAFFWVAKQITDDAGVPGLLAALTLLLCPLAIPGLRRLARSRYAIAQSSRGARTV